jgi:hypothetical protein
MPAQHPHVHVPPPEQAILLPSRYTQLQKAVIGKVRIVIETRDLKRIHDQRAG